MRDSCNLEAKALEESLNFVIDKVPDVCQGNETNQTGKSGKLAAVIGATKSSVTAQVAKLLRLFKIPQVCLSLKLIFHLKSLKFVSSVFLCYCV